MKKTSISSVDPFDSDFFYARGSRNTSTSNGRGGNRLVNNGGLRSHPSLMNPRSRADSPKPDNTYVSREEENDNPRTNITRVGGEGGVRRGTEPNERVLENESGFDMTTTNVGTGGLTNKFQSETKKAGIISENGIIIGLVLLAIFGGFGYYYYSKAKK